MLTKESLLEILQQNVSPDGTYQFNFSSNLSDKHAELKVLKELESEGYIQRLTGTLSYALYRIL